MTPKEKLYFELTRATVISDHSEDSVPTADIFEILEKHLHDVEQRMFEESHAIGYRDGYKAGHDDASEEECNCPWT